jgi:outer membrane protein TolC
MRSLSLICGLLCIGVLQGQDLASYIGEAQENNPEIKAYMLRYELAEEKVNETGWVPNTELSAGYFVSEPETRTGAQKARFTVRQMLPWFGTVSAREEYARARAETGYLDYIIARRKLALEVTRSYYLLYAHQGMRDILDTNIALLETYEQLALAYLEVDKASAVDVLRLQIRQNELQQQKDVHHQQYLAELSVFNGLLNRDAALEVAMPADLTLPEEDIVQGDSLQLNPELLLFDQLYASVAQEELLNQKESAPAFGLGLDYIPVEKRPGLDFSDNGKDVLMPMVSFSIPIFNNRYTSRSRQNELRQLELESMKQQRRTVLQTALAQAKSERNAARIQYSTQVENLKQARDVEEILLKSFESGSVDFKDLLEIQELQLAFQLNQVQSVQMYYLQSAIINYLVNQ